MIKTRHDIGALQAKLLATLDDSPGVLVQAGATLLYSLHMVNTVAGIGYLQLFNAVQLSDVTLGTTTPTLSIPVAASGLLNMDLNVPVLFPLGLCIFATTTATGASANIMHGAIFYA